MKGITKPSRLEDKVRSWWQTHLRCFLTSLGQLLRTPTTTLLTVTVIGIALALPAGLILVVNQLQTLTEGLNTTNSISLYFKKDISDDHVTAIRDKLEKDERVNHIIFISSDQALKEFRELSGQGDLIDLLDENPLPTTLHIVPTAEASPKQLDSLVRSIKSLKGIDQVVFDSGWARRLQSIITLLDRFVLVLSALLIFAVVLIIGTTIRIGIQSRLQEIQISRLFGATKAFIRRPFLYSGSLYGLIGGIIACVLLLTSWSLLSEPLHELVSSWQLSPSASSSPLFRVCLLVIVGGVLLGVISSWIAVAFYQKELETSEFI